MLRKSLIHQTSKVLDFAKACFSGSIKSLEEGRNRRRGCCDFAGSFSSMAGFFLNDHFRLKVLLSKSALFSIGFQLAVIGKSFSERFRSCLASSSFKVPVFIYSQILQ